MTFFFRPQTSHWSVHFLEKLLKLPKAKSASANLVRRVTPFFFNFFEVTYKTGRD